MRGAASAALALSLTLFTLASPAAAQQPAQVVRQLAFEGNSAVTDEVLASAIATTNSSWFARVFLVRWLGLGEKRYFDEQEFRRDVVRLEVLYRRSGYPHVQIDTAVRRTPENVFITFKIKEGEPTKVAAFGVTGLDSLPAKIREETLVDLPLRHGDPFNRFRMQAASDTITRRLKDRG
jgi:outer membrane protein assembly factor BamA